MNIYHLMYTISYSTVKLHPLCKKIIFTLKYNVFESTKNTHFHYFILQSLHSEMFWLGNVIFGDYTLSLRPFMWAG